jgi:hypothetical protein
MLQILTLTELKAKSSIIDTLVLLQIPLFIAKPTGADLRFASEVPVIQMSLLKYLSYKFLGFCFCFNYKCLRCYCNSMII